MALGVWAVAQSLLVLGSENHPRGFMPVVGGRREKTAIHLLSLNYLLACSDLNKTNSWPPWSFHIMNILKKCVISHVGWW